MTAKKEIATKKETAIATTEAPDYLKDQMQSNAGNEDVSINDMVIPRVGIIQALSPQKKKSQPEYIEGAEEGQIFNNVSSEIYGEEVNIVPATFKKEWLLWVDRKAGGGFRGAYSSEAEAKAARDEDEKADDIDVIDTHQHFVLIIRPDGTTDEAVISMSKSQAKISRKLNSIIRMAGGPRFSRVYSLSSVEEANANGDLYMNWNVKQVGFPAEEVFEKAKALYEAVRSGTASADRNDGSVTDDGDSTVHEGEGF
jgi:hypothetical protein